MRRILLYTSILLGAAFTACQEKSITYNDAEYIMFQDTLSYYAVLQDQDYFTVPVVSTVACDYDRTIAVEIIDKGSTAVEGRDYRLASNTLVIPAGESRTDIQVYPQYDRFGETDTLSFNLKLVMPEQLVMDLYGDETRISMYKVCPYDIHTFTGWCVVTSMFLYSYPGLDSNGLYQRLIKTEAAPDEENTIIMHDWLFDGYDVRLKFDSSDPENQIVTMPEGQVISDEEFVFGQVNGDNRILATSSPAYVSYFNSCQSFVSLWMRAYVYNLSSLVGYVGDFYHLMEWVSDEEADRLQNESGL